MRAAARYSVLGPVEGVTGEGGALVPRGHRQRLLLALLLSRVGEDVSAEWLSDALWPEPDRPAHPIAALQSQISRLRRRVTGASLVTRGATYCLAVSPSDLDAAEFARTTARAHAFAADPDAALRWWDASLEMWRGPAYGDCADHPDLAPEATRLDELRVAALEGRAACLLVAGRFDDAAAAARRIAADHELRDRPRELLMRALHSAGRSADALTVFHDYRDVLRTELGLDPPASLVRTQREILQGGPADAPRRIEGGLPTPTSSFVGRAADVQLVEKSLRTAPIVTVTGPGGVGKTRLAVEVAHELSGRYDHHVWLCDLADVAPDGLASAVAAVLLVQHGGRDVERRLLESLHPLHALVVLDNCERIAGDVARLAERIVAAAPRVDVLVTSRVHLGADGEQRVAVAPLPDPEPGDSDAPAVRLFADRMAAARPGFILTSGDLATVTEICRRLDRLPLAIELAAARGARLSPAEIEAGLHPLVTTDLVAAGSDRRHESLTTVIGASYDALDERAKKTLDHLSVLAGHFTAEAAAAVLGLPGDAAVDLRLADLVDRSLVEATDHPHGTRYTMLETVRAFAAERLAARGLTDAARSRHLDFFIERASAADRGMCGRDERRWIDTLDLDLPNLGLAQERLLAAGDTRALRLAGGLYWYGYTRMQPEVSAWAARACERFADSRHPRLPGAISVAAVGAWRSGDLARAKRLADDALRLSNDPETARRAHEVAGDVAIFHGRLAQARTAMERAAALSQGEADVHQEAMDLGSAAVAAAYAHDSDSLAAAHHLAERAIALAARSGNPTARAWTTYVAGEIRLETEPATARALLSAAMDLADDVGDRFVQGVVLVSLASIEARAGDPRDALDRLARVLDLWRRGGTWLQQWTTIRVLVETLTRLSRNEPAAILLGAVRSRSTATPVFGPDTERATRVRRQLEAALGTREMEQLEAAGAAMDDQSAVAYAMQSVA